MKRFAVVVILGLCSTFGMQSQEPLTANGLIVTPYKPLPQGVFTSTSTTNQYCRTKVKEDTQFATFRGCITVPSEYSWKDAFGLVADTFYQLSDENDRLMYENYSLREELRKATMPRISTKPGCCKDCDLPNVPKCKAEKR